MKKVWEFVKKNWSWILIVPAVLMVIAMGIRFYIRMLIDRDDGTDNQLHKVDQNYKKDTDKISEDEKKAVDNIRKERDTLTTRIENGDPSAADVMNDFIGVKRDGEEEKKQ